MAWVGEDILKYEPDEMELLHQILFPTKYTIDYSKLPYEQRESLKMTDAEFAEYKSNQITRLSNVGTKYRERDG
jgi:hypothetical protein